MQVYGTIEVEGQKDIKRDGCERMSCYLVTSRVRLIVAVWTTNPSLDKTNGFFYHKNFTSFLADSSLMLTLMMLRFQKRFAFLL
jgi:hypothetical protein